MALSIVESCVNCWACVDLCPSEAIYATSTHFKIAPNKCTECEGDYANPQCASICPIEEAILDSLGRAMNPAGSLTGISPEKLEAAMQEIQAR